MRSKKPIRNMLVVLVLGLSLCGCSNFLGGAVGGAAGAGAGYEWSARMQMDKIDEDLKEGRIEQVEYDIRKDQIKRGSLLYR